MAGGWRKCRYWRSTVGPGPRPLPAVKNCRAAAAARVEPACAQVTTRAREDGLWVRRDL